MEASEASKTVRLMLRSPEQLRQGTAHVEKHVQTKGFLLGLAMIATDDSTPDPRERLISFRLPVLNLPNGFASLSVSYMAALVLKYVVTEYWESGKLKANEKTTIKQIVMEKLAGTNGRIALHLVFALGHLVGHCAGSGGREGVFPGGPGHLCARGGARNA